MFRQTVTGRPADCRLGDRKTTGQRGHGDEDDAKDRRCEVRGTVHGQHLGQRPDRPHCTAATADLDFTSHTCPSPPPPTPTKCDQQWLSETDFLEIRNEVQETDRTYGMRISTSGEKFDVSIVFLDPD